MNERRSAQRMPRSDGVNVTKSGPVQGRAVAGAPDGSGFPAWLLAVVLAAGTLILYWPAVHYDFINYDDPDYVTANLRVEQGLTPGDAVWAFTTGHASNWHPMTWLSLMLDASVFGKKAAGFHLTNVVLQAANAALLFWVLRRMTGAKWRSALVAAVFAWHPLQVESVAWVTERKNVLSLFFGLLALLWYHGYAQARERARARPAGRPGSPAAAFYGAALFVFALSLMSKPMLVTWPFVLLLLDYWPLERGKPGRWGALVGEKIPFMVLAAVTSLVTMVVQKKARISGELFPAGERVENAVISYVRYLGKLFWPENLAVIYPHPGYWPMAWVLLAGSFLTAVSVVFWRWRGRYPFLLVGWLWYGGTLVPVSGLVQVGGQAMADRYAYVPLVGALVAVVWGAFELGRRWRVQAAALTVAGVTVLAVCLFLTRRQLGYWQNSEILFRHALAVTGNNYLAHYDLGRTLLDQGRNEEAMREIKESLRLEPNFAEAMDNLGLTLDKLGQTDAAIVQYEASLGIKPDDAEAHNNLALALGERGQTAAAIHEYELASRFDPEMADPHNNLGILLARQGQTDAAIGQLEEAIRLKPDYAVAHNNLGIILGANGRLDEAIGEFQAALRCEPGFVNARDNLAMALKLGNSAKPATPGTTPARP